MLVQANLLTNRMHRDEEMRLQAAADAAEVVKKNELNHLKSQSNFLNHRSLEFLCDDPNSKHLFENDDLFDSENKRTESTNTMDASTRTMRRISVPLGGKNGEAN